VTEPDQNVEAGDLDAYLERLGLDPEPPSADALDRLHRAQVERVPYETVWIHQGLRWTADPGTALRRVAHDGRGGYCYHLNGALALLLGTLGYRVTRHVGGVHGPDGPAIDSMTNHLVLRVHDLPDDDNPGGVWYVDAGLGDALHAPLPLVPGDYSQPPFRFSLDEIEDGVGNWHFAHDPAGSFTGMSFRSEAAPPGAFDVRHQFLSSSPESGFVRVCTVQRRTPRGVDILRGRVFSAADGPVTTLDDPGAWFDLVADLGVRVGDDPDHRDALWARVTAAHEAHVAAPAEAEQAMAEEEP